eukprot:8613558-Karenia_brevis.AAC.1
MKQIHNIGKLYYSTLGFGENRKELTVNGDREAKIDDWELELLGEQEAKAYRGVATRLNFMSLDCPDMQFPTKQSSKEMANPTIASWR